MHASGLRGYSRTQLARQPQHTLTSHSSHRAKSWAKSRASHRQSEGQSLAWPVPGTPRQRTGRRNSAEDEWLRHDHHCHPQLQMTQVRSGHCPGCGEDRCAREPFAKLGVALKLSARVVTSALYRCEAEGQSPMTMLIGISPTRCLLTFSSVSLRIATTRRALPSFCICLSMALSTSL